MTQNLLETAQLVFLKHALVKHRPEKMCDVSNEHVNDDGDNRLPVPVSIRSSCCLPPLHVILRAMPEGSFAASDVPMARSFGRGPQDDIQAELDHSKDMQ